MFKEKKLIKRMSYLLLTGMVMSLIVGAPVSQRNVEAATITLNNPQGDCEAGTASWDYIYFGKYWQNDTNADGVVDVLDSKEPILWRLLSVSGNKAVLLAEQNVDAATYHESQEIITWAECQLRTWLNETFYINAFTDNERAAIQSNLIFTKGDSFLGTQDVTTIDKIYIPSFEDVTNSNYGFAKSNGENGNRMATNTNYTATKPGMYAGGVADVYWLRNNGQFSDRMAVMTNGICDYQMPADMICGIRPMLELDISNVDLWQYKDSDSIDGSIDEEKNRVVNLLINGQENYDYAYQVLDILNQTRAEVGKSQLTMDKELLDVAMQRAAEISTYYSHTRPNGEECFSIFRLNDVSCGVVRAENIACGQTSPESVMTAWNNSQGHYKNIINSKYQSVGIGCFTDTDGVCYWVQCFDNAAWTSPENKYGTKKVTRNVSILNKYITLSTDSVIVVGCADQTTERKMIINNVNHGWSYSRAELAPTNFEYVSDNLEVAEVNENGVITLKATGKAVITATLKGNPSIQITKAITKKDHEYASNVIAPTHTSHGYTRHVCNGCGDMYDDNYIPKLTDSDGTDKNISTVPNDENTNKKQPETNTSPDNIKENVPSKLKKITGVSVKNKKPKSISIKWKKQKEIDGYQVQIATKKNFRKGKKTKTAYVNNLTWKGLKKGKTYYVRVRVYRYDEDFDKKYGPWSAVKKIKVKK